MKKMMIPQVLSAILAMTIAAAATAQKFVLPPLPYAYNALEPHISAQTMQLHHSKHLQGYVNNLNSLTAGTKYADADLETLVRKADGALLSNAGQVLNHTMYFQEFSPTPQPRPTGKLAAEIDKHFGSYDAFVEQYTKAAAGLFGSGWVWLARKPSGLLVITQEANGGNPLSRGLQPLVGCDVWEHAYYLDYQNRRSDYISAFWKVLDWKVIEQLFNK